VIELKIPQEMKECRQFIVWGANTQKPKQPCSPLTLLSDNWQHPDNWGTYDQAKQVVKAGHAKGIGFCFNGNGIYGVDLDNVFIDGKLILEAQDIVNRLDSYTEYSMSENGLHIFVYAPGVDLLGPLGKGKTKLAFPNYPQDEKRAFEIYQSAGYVALTGNLYEGRDITC